LLLSGCKGTTFSGTTKIFPQNIFYFEDFYYFCGVDNYKPISKLT
jgi:hypothetical protein